MGVVFSNTNLRAAAMSRIASSQFSVILLTQIIFLSGCVSVGEIPPPMMLRSKIDPQKFAECMAPLASGIKPGFDGLLSKLQQPPDSGVLNEKLKSIFEVGFFENKWNVYSWIEELLIKIATDIRIPTPVDADGSDLEKSIKTEADKLVKPTKDDIIKSVERTEAYFLAYFTKSVSQTSNSIILDADNKSKLQFKLAKVLNRKPDDPSLGKVVDELTPELQKIIAPISQPLSKAPGFVGRDGTVYAFPGIAVSKGNSVTIDHIQIGSDFIRIIFESIRDTYAPLPVLSNSTASWITHQCNKDSQKYCRFKDDKIAALNFNNDQGEQNFEWNIDRAGHIPTFKSKIKAEEFEEIEANARNAESSMAEAVGMAIRGGSWGSLNNEAVAKFIETAAGVLARHVSERTQWCARYSK